MAVALRHVSGVSNLQLERSLAQQGCNPGSYFDQSRQTCVRCSGCGSFQDEAGQTSCKTATVESCGEGKVPKFIQTWMDPPTTLDSACALVPAGNYFKDAAGSTYSTCYFVSQCSGCGSYQDEAGKTSCKETSCSSGEKKLFTNGAVSSKEACVAGAKAGTFLNISENCVRSCMGCGLWSPENSSECEITSCQDGEFPIIVFEADSPKKACRAPGPGEGASKSECSVRPCYRDTSIKESGFTCPTLQDCMSYIELLPSDNLECATWSATNSSIESFLSFSSRLDALCFQNDPHEKIGCDCENWPTPRPSLPPTSLPPTSLPPT
eukprot:CAMPEP_0194262060 /NCGR_PEP_ID=MMETSP0158-20130606/46349_1 /TAXON_ID=33649 /ORGANISM="Thalassionema nitzschioides, Strain L26-B" /LENGTH=322 /DNA_ID=CAMNT_0039002205 /DNA_START=109 /DNA_END=1074 /DNA_ORIENTATION=+